MTEYNFTLLGNTVIFLISGKAGTGKSYSAKILSELVDSLGFMDFTTMHFATGVKETAKKSFGWDGKKDQLGRRLLQDVGQTGRRYNKDMWVRQVVTKIKSNPGMYDFVFIDDWRFPNELAYLYDNIDALVVAVRIIAPEREILKGTKEYKEVSETSLRDKEYFYHYTIDNSGSKEHLTEQLNTMLHEVIKKNIGE